MCPLVHQSAHADLHRQKIQLSMEIREKTGAEKKRSATNNEQELHEIVRKRWYITIWCDLFDKLSYLFSKKQS